jgi:hypothetical protein
VEKAGLTSHICNENYDEGCLHGFGRAGTDAGTIYHSHSGEVHGARTSDPGFCPTWRSRAEDLAHNSGHRPEVAIGGTLANFSTVIGPFFDRFAEVEPNEDARIRILGRRLGEAGIRAEHW